MVIIGALAALLPGTAYAGGPYQFHSISPCRVADTRTGSGGILSSSTARDITVRSVCGIPTGATAVVLNATVVGPTATGFLTIYPADLGSPPTVATLTFNAGEPALGNGAIVPLGAATDIKMIYGVGSGSATTHVVLDATGYFATN
ncbi:MAG TPA: hypothetical protein VMM92_06555 [Thermoanaerobaculia bacterium]|nr:hypothetical protein [Thermoanaerobaculia bacterium]